MKTYRYNEDLRPEDGTYHVAYYKGVPVGLCVYGKDNNGESLYFIGAEEIEEWDPETVLLELPRAHF